MWEVLSSLIGQTKRRSVPLCHRKTRVTIWCTPIYDHVVHFHIWTYMAIWYTSINGHIFALKHLGLPREVQLNNITSVCEVVFSVYAYPGLKTIREADWDIFPT